MSFVESPPLAGYTTPPDPMADQLIAGHMTHIRDVILATTDRQVRSIVLTGGFGRGEGGVTYIAGAPRPVNDYDLLVVSRRDGFIARLLLRRRLKAIEPALTAALGIRADITVKTPSMLRNAPPTVEAYEMAAGHRIIWGDASVMGLMPARSPEMLDSAEASRYLFNRGAALLWARRFIEALPAPDEARWQFILIALTKAWLAWGDALLILHGRYTAQYSERAGRLAGLPLPENLSFLPDLYRQGLEFKLRPDFERYRRLDIHQALEQTIVRHETVWHWVETYRGTAAGAGDAFWLDYYRRPGWRIRAASGPVALRHRLENFVLNLWRVRPLTFQWIFQHPEERLARLLPLLLFIPQHPDLPWREVSALLGVWPATAAVSALSDRFLTIWHPGNPLVEMKGA